MKTVTALIAFAATAMAQSAYISLPLENAQLKAGSDVVVQIQRPNSLTGSQEIGVGIGFQSCPTDGCRDVEDVLGTVLYHGAFTPSYHDGTPGYYQNFTVTIPAGTPAGRAQFGVAHATLVGAGPYSMLEDLNRTVIIVA